MLDFAVIGGGAAGFFAAINVKIKHPEWDVQIFERSSSILSKVRVSGGGRCNVTHACFDAAELISYYPRGKRELLSVFRRFGPADTIKWFESRGVMIKKESDGRMFPVSDDSQTIIDCFTGECHKLGIRINTSSSLRNLETGENFKLNFEDHSIEAAKVLFACGSSNHMWAKIGNLGHRIISPVPSLFTFNIKHPLIKDLQGLSLRNATLKLSVSPELIKKNGLKQSELIQSGPLLITHWGLSGPAVLKLSSVAARLLNELNYRFDIIAALNNMGIEQTFEVLQDQRKMHPKKQILNTTLFEIPQRLWQRLCTLSVEPADLVWADVSNKQLRQLAENISAFTFKVEGKSTFKEEFVTAGGVDLKDVDFKNMESKHFPGLYFAGEVLNIDALTGGFNFQAAWSESWVIADSL